MGCATKGTEMMRLLMGVLLLSALGCTSDEDRAEDTCAKVYDECGLRWSVPDKTFSRAECVDQLVSHSEGEDAARTEQIEDCAETASCETVLDCFND